MAISSAQIVMGLSIVETITVNVPDVAGANAVITHDQFNRATTLTASTTPPVTQTASQVATLSAGLLTLDLTALTGTNGATVNLNGLKPVAVKFQAPASNANPITIAKGASNGYTGLGASFSLTLQPGQEAEFYLAAGGTAVGGAVKTLDLTGTGSQVLNVQIVAGT